MSKLKLKGESKTWTWTTKKLMSSSFLKPFSCIGILYILSEWGGSNIILSYMITILKESGSSIDPEDVPIYVGIIRLIIAGTV